MGTHLQLDGTWAHCARPAACPLLFHLELDVAEAACLPQLMIYPLLEAIQPPTRIIDGWLKVWENEDGRYHRDYDLPAHIAIDGTLKWYQDGLFHRGGDKPAFIDVRGSKIWCHRGKYHRDNDRPARILAGQVQQWYQHGKLHRGHDLPASIHVNGDREWYFRGQLHRGGGLPAVVQANGLRRWYEHGIPLAQARPGEAPTLSFA